MSKSNSSWRVWRGPTGDRQHHLHASDFLTRDERVWMHTNSHPIAWKLRLWLVVLLEWPFPDPPILIIRPLIAAMRLLRSGAPLPTGPRLKKLLAEYRVGDDVKLAAERARMAPALAESVLVIHGRM
jgi:hypothetical protein